MTAPAMQDNVEAGMRTDRVLNAVQRRISEQGDMPIRISRGTMRTLLRGVGLGKWEVGDEPFREIDALALDALRHLAWQRRPLLSSEGNGRS